MGGKKDMCKAKGCYQRELRKVRGEGEEDTKDMCKVRGATNGN